jgi:hypothetical protein
MKIPSHAVSGGGKILAIGVKIEYNCVKEEL